jgi:hypothetical protein
MLGLLCVHAPVLSAPDQCSKLAALRLEVLDNAPGAAAGLLFCSYVSASRRTLHVRRQHLRSCTAVDDQAPTMRFIQCIM